MGRPRKKPEQSSSSIYRGADGNWHARVTVGRQPDGTPQRRHLQRQTKPELRDAVRDLERTRDTGGHMWTTDDISLEHWLEHWLEAVLPMTVRWKTRSTYHSLMRVHVLPALGRWSLSELRPEIFEEHYRLMQRHGHSTHVIRAVHRVLRSSLNEAVRRRRITTNPLQVARPPRAEHVEVEPLTVEECRRVLEAAQATMHPARWSLALSLGLRQGEALGLFWSDLDLDDGVLRVRRSVQRHTWAHGCPTVNAAPSCGNVRAGACDRRVGGLVLVEPKTKASRRSIVLPAPVVDELRAHRAVLVKRRLASGSRWDSTHDLVFPAPFGGLIDPARDNREWNRLIAEAGVRDVRLHDARHTAATLLLLQNVDIRTVMSVMGWTEMATAQRYTHAVDALRRQAARRMGDLLWETKVQS